MFVMDMNYTSVSELHAWRMQMPLVVRWLPRLIELFVVRWFCSCHEISSEGCSHAALPQPVNGAVVVDCFLCLEDEYFLRVAAANGPDLPHTASDGAVDHQELIHGLLNTEGPLS